MGDKEIATIVLYHVYMSKDALQKAMAAKYHYCQHQRCIHASWSNARDIAYLSWYYKQVGSGGKDNCRRVNGAIKKDRIQKNYRFKSCLGRGDCVVVAAEAGSSEQFYDEEGEFERNKIEDPDSVNDFGALGPERSEFASSVSNNSKAVVDLLDNEQKQQLFRHEDVGFNELTEDSDEFRKEQDLIELSRYNLPKETLDEMMDEDIERWAQAARRGRWDVTNQHLLNHIKKTSRMLTVCCKNKYSLVPFIAARAQLLDDASKAAHPTAERFFKSFPIQNKEFVSILLTWEDYIRWVHEISESSQLERDEEQRRQLTSVSLSDLNDALLLDPKKVNAWNVLLNYSAFQGHHERTELFGDRLRISRVSKTLMFRPLKEVRLYKHADTTMFEYHQGSDAVFRRLARAFEFDAAGGWLGGRLDVIHFH